MKKVLIINEGGTVNLGDKAINKVITEKVKESNKEVCFGHYSAPSNTNLVPQKMSYSLPSLKKKVMLKIFFTLNKYTLNVIAYLLWIKRNKKAVKSIVATPRLYYGIIGGGQLLKSNGSFPIALYYWAKMMSMNNIPYSIYGVGVSDDMDVLSKYLIKRAIRNSDKTYVREHYSKEVLLNYKVNKEIKIIPDVAFAYSDIQEPKEAKKQLLVMPASYEYVYKAYNEGKTYDAYIKDWVDQSLKYMESIDVDQVVISYSTISQDRSTAYAVYQKMKMKFDNVEFRDVSSLFEFIDLINISSATYSARMHPLIIAASYGRTVYTSRISKKLEVFEDQLINHKSFDIDSIRAKISKSIDEMINDEE